MIPLVMIVFLLLLGYK